MTTCAVCSYKWDCLCGDAQPVVYHGPLLHCELSCMDGQDWAYLAKQVGDAYLDYDGL